MQPQYDPFEDPSLIRGLDPTTTLVIKTLSHKAKLRWEKFKGTANNSVSGAAILVLILFLPLRFGVQAVGRVFLVERVLQDFLEYGNKYRR